jgi:hypothetical protein
VADDFPSTCPHYDNFRHNAFHHFRIRLTHIATVLHEFEMARRRRQPRPGALADLAPLRILAHIALLQISYYAVAAVLIVFVTLTAGGEISAGRIFDWRLVRSDVTTGWTLGLCWMLDALIT